MKIEFNYKKVFECGQGQGPDRQSALMKLEREPLFEAKGDERHWSMETDAMEYGEEVSDDWRSVTEEGVRPVMCRETGGLEGIPERWLV